VRAAARILALGLALAAASCASSPPPDPTGSWGADVPALGSYSRRVELDLRAQGRAALSLSSDEGQLHSYREGRWEASGGRIVVTLYTKTLLGQADPKAPPPPPTPHEVLTLAFADGDLTAVDFDRQRWDGIALQLRRAAPAAPLNPQE